MSSSFDPFWLSAIEFLTCSLHKEDVVLAPNALRSSLQGCRFKNYQTTFYGGDVQAFDVAVVHKGMTDRIEPAALNAIDRSFVPVFANEVFVIFAKAAPSEAWVNSTSEHLQAYWESRAHRQDEQPIEQCADHSTFGKIERPIIQPSSQEMSRDFVPNIDVLLCSYRKCGRTWLRFILSFYINELCQLGYPPSRDTMVILVPSFKIVEDDVPLASIQTEQYSGKRGLRAIAASHQNYGNPNAPSILAGKDIIFLFRSVCDVLVSQYFERVFRRDFRPRDTIWQFIQEEHLLEAYVDYLNAWAYYLDRHRHIILTYEEMKHDIFHASVRVLEFMEVEVDLKVLAHAIELSSFDSMQKMERQELGLDDASDQTARLRTRRGKIGGYRDYLDENAVHTIRQYCEDNLSVSAKAMFEAHNLDVA
jgi:alcohol sulfotransferase